MDFDQLAYETLTLKGSFQGKNPFDVHRFDEITPTMEEFWAGEEALESDSLDAEVDSLQQWLYPDSPGLVYLVDRVGSTFCLRGSAVANIQEYFQLVKQDQSLVIDSFRWSKEELAKEGWIDRIQFYETDSLELAEVIRDQFFNRRFPVEEEMLCNLSDPGFSWWLKKGALSSDLYFRCHGINRGVELISLGPMGDRGIASYRFEELLGELTSLASLSDIRCTDKQVSFKCAPVSLSLLNEWSEFLEFGVMPETILNHLSSLPDKTLYYYTRELAVLRLFWIEIEHHLQDQVDLR